MSCERGYSAIQLWVLLGIHWNKIFSFLDSSKNMKCKYHCRWDNSQAAIVQSQVGMKLLFLNLPLPLPESVSRGIAKRWSFLCLFFTGYEFLLEGLLGRAVWSPPGAQQLFLGIQFMDCQFTMLKVPKCSRPLWFQRASLQNHRGVLKCWCSCCTCVVVIFLPFP